MIVLDTETTGLMEPELCDINLQPRITEIYACVLNDDFEIVKELETLINPLIPIPEHITKITGITDDMVSGMPTFMEIYPALCDMFCGQTESVGHNVTFDLDVIKIELRRLGLEHKFPWTQHRRCTVELSFPIENKRLKLGQLYKIVTGKELVGSHRAKNDVMATAQCYAWLKENKFV